jgi:hypothetical protein
MLTCCKIVVSLNAFLLFILLVEVQIPYLVLGGTMVSNSLIELVLYKLKLNISELFKSETTKVLH